MSTPPFLARLEQGLASASAGDFLGTRPARGGRPAAVLIALYLDAADELSMVSVEKSGRLRNHAGQLAFPGGSLEPTDASPVAGALREAQEEVGIDPASVEVMGVLPGAHVAASGFDVTSVVGWWPTPLALTPVDVGEIAAIHALRVSDLADPANRLTWRLSSGHQGPGFVLGDLFVWGFTAHLIDGLLELGGWAQPWDAARTAPVPRRFFRRSP